MSEYDLPNIIKPVAYHWNLEYGTCPSKQILPSWIYMQGVTDSIG